MNNTAISVCTYHRIFDGNGWKNIVKFKNQNFQNFFVLFDNQKSLDIKYISSNFENANILLYDDNDFINNQFNKSISTKHFWGSHQNPKYFYAHFRMLYFYLKNKNYDYYWFFDDDVTFDGDLYGLLSSYSNVYDDFISIQAFKKENYIEFPNISIINSRMTGSRGMWLDHCPGDGDNFKSTHRHIGCFYPIVRYSKRALEHLLFLHNNGYYGYSEGFVPTSLASDGFSVSSMLNEFNQYYIENNFCELKHKGIKFTWEWL